MRHQQLVILPPEILLDRCEGLWFARAYGAAESSLDLNLKKQPSRQQL